MKLWTDVVSPLRDGAGYTYDQAARIAAERTLALALRRQDLATASAQAWEYRWRFDTGYLTGIELMLRDQIETLQEGLRRARGRLQVTTGTAPDPK